MKNALAIIIIFALALNPVLPVLAAPEDEELSLTVKDFLEMALPDQEGRRIVFNEDKKLLTVTDTPTNHRLIENLLNDFDIEPEQVTIEARLVEIDIKDVTELGVQWHIFTNAQMESGTSDASDGIVWDDSTATTFPKTSTGADLFISKTNQSGEFIRAYLHALEERQKANLLSSPRVTTLSGQMANIQIVRTIPYVTDVDIDNTGTAENPIWQYNYDIAERTTGITLVVTPTIAPGTKKILLDINPEISILKSQISIFPDQVPNSMGWPVVDTRSTEASIMIESGQTIILGGLIRDDDKETKRKVPFLGDIPLLGKLFQYKYTSREKKNLMIFLTATIAPKVTDKEEIGLYSGEK